MIDPGLYVAFVLASALLILTPGPMVALITANAARYGFSAGLVTVAGSCAAMSLHLVAVCLGLSAFLASLGGALFWLKWAGAAYLLYLGVRSIMRVRPANSESAPPPAPARRIAVEAFFVALANPKVLLFYAAFFPVFIAPERPAGPQLAVLSVTFLAIAAILDAGWALAGSRAGRWLGRAGDWISRLSGGALIAAAVAVAAQRRP